MILTAHQPMFMPWLGLFAKIAAADQFVVFDDVPFERHGFGNRNKILTHSGVQWLTVPVHLDDHLERPIRTIEIADEHYWRRKHLRTIELAYQKAPHFEAVFDAVKAIYAKDWRTLAGLNQALLSFFMGYLEINVPILTASEQGFRGEKSDLVLDMCIKCGATEYIFGAQGRGYADLEAFERAGIKVWFQDYQHPTYPQLHGGFEPYMSILDLVMNCGPESREILLSSS